MTFQKVSILGRYNCFKIAQPYYYDAKVLARSQQTERRARQPQTGHFIGHANPRLGSAFIYFIALCANPRVNV